MKQPADIQALSKRMLECAGSGVPRAQFLKEVSQMLIAHVGCDAVRLVLRDHGRRYRSELTCDTTLPFRFEATPGFHDGGTELLWSSGDNDALEQLCRDILYRRVDPSEPWFTDHGSMWTGDINSVPIAGLRQVSMEKGLGIRIDEDCTSVALMHFEAGREYVGLVQLASKAEDFFRRQEIESYERLTQAIGLALSHRRLQVALRERVKELTCLYGIAKLVGRPGISLDELLQDAVELLPPAWLYPDVASARIVLDGRTFLTGGSMKPVQNMNADIIVNGKRRGLVEVGYAWEKPQIDEGPFLNEERNLIDAVARDISIIVKQRRAEEDKLRLQEQLRHSDRLATIGQLGAGLAHELNEPLAGILGFAQLVTKDQSLSDQSRQDIEKIIASALHTREVIAKLLVFARETTPEKTRINLNSLVKNELSFLESRCASGGIDILHNLSEDLPLIIADHGQLLQVVTNLVVNSIQAMPEGGRLTISTLCDDGHVLLVVEDTGIGMSKKVMEKIFNPFFTTKDVDQGTGLGLSVVHGIVTSHSGAIDVESELGRSTKFTVRLPVDASANKGEESNG